MCGIYTVPHDDPRLFFRYPQGVGSSWTAARQNSHPRSPPGVNGPPSTQAHRRYARILIRVYTYNRHCIAAQIPPFKDTKAVHP